MKRIFTTTMGFDYSEFEAYFRGSRDEVRIKLAWYLPLVTGLDIDDTCPALDIACGRGEWLELLREINIPVYGVDNSRDFVVECRNSGLSVEECDLFEYLAGEHTCSYKLITGFHIVEHLAFEKQLQLLEHAFARLSPGGALILETPNPENTMVGCCNFYIDPTHKRPVPPMLLQYLALKSGYASPMILRVNRSVADTPLQLMPNDIPEAPYYNQIAGLLSSLSMQAQDYALLAFKPPAPNNEILEAITTLNMSPSSVFEPCGNIRTDTPPSSPVSAADKKLQQKLSALQLELNDLHLHLQDRNQDLEHLKHDLQQERRLRAEAQVQIQQSIEKSDLLEKQLHHTARELKSVNAILDDARDDKVQNHLRLQQQEVQLTIANREIEQLEKKQQATSNLLLEREKELKSIYRTAAGKLVLLYKKFRRKNTSSTAAMPSQQQCHSLEHNINEVPLSILETFNKLCAARKHIEDTRNRKEQ